jgi:cation diffusion facilitator CzcD-associated flavoprotein CzcO
VLPRRQRDIKAWEHTLYKVFPPAQRAAREAIYWAREFMFLPGFLRPRFMRPQQKLGEGWLERVVRDPELRAKLTPDYTIGCKRILLSTKYLPALTKENVDVVTSGITEIRPNSIVTADGVEHEVDTIIFGTGFHVTDLPIAEHIKGKDGRSLAETWEGSPKAYLGSTVPGFPNLFLLLGPNTGLGHTSVIVMIEAQIDHVRSALERLRTSNGATIEVTEAALDGWIKEVDRKIKPTVWSSGGCSSYYMDKTGRNSSIWPGFTFTFRLRAKRLKASDYTVAPRRAATDRPLVDA